MPLYENTKSFAVASDGVRFNPYQKIAVSRQIPLLGTLRYNNVQQDFSFGKTVVGDVSNAEAVVQLFDDDQLGLSDIQGTFQDGEILRVGGVHTANADGVVDYFFIPIDPEPYPSSGLLISTEIVFAGAEDRSISVNKKAAILEFMRISSTNVTVFLDNVLNTPGILLKPGEYQSVNIKAYEVETLILRSVAAGGITVRQLIE